MTIDILLACRVAAHTHSFPPCLFRRTLGNQKLPFSRSFLGSSSRRGLIERPFTGDRAFGTPGRALAIRAEAAPGEDDLLGDCPRRDQYSPDGDQLRLDGHAEAVSGLSEGPMLAGRVEFHPLGEVPRDHGDFARGAVRFTIDAAAYRWWNDDDVVPQGIGSSVHRRQPGSRSVPACEDNGLSVEAELDRITASAIHRQATSELYNGGEAALNKASVEVGYLFVPPGGRGWLLPTCLDADTFESTWQRLSFGINAYVNGHRSKFSLMHRESSNDVGTNGARSRQTFIRSQYAF